MDSSAFDAVKPYLNRAVGDEEVRKSAIRAFTAARKVYDELSGDDALKAAKKLSSNDDVREGLDTTVQSLSEALVRMAGEKPKHNRSWIPMVLLGGLLLVFFNPVTGAATRRWVKDHLFGSEEEFDYATPRY